MVVGNVPTSGVAVGGAGMGCRSGNEATMGGLAVLR